MAEETSAVRPEDELNDRQKLFCQIYARCLNATKSAREAGYSGSTETLAATGYENLNKPHIRAYVDQLLKEKTLSATETIKSISDIANGDLKEYFTTTKKVHIPKVRLPLADYIERLKEEAETADYVHRIAAADGLLGDGEELDAEIKRHKNDQRNRKMQILRHEVRLAKDPSATIIVDGEPELVEVAELDVARLVQDEKAGKIKSVKTTEHGPQVELYAADAALRDLAKYHGLFEKHNNQKATKISFGLDAEKEEYTDD